MAKERSVEVLFTPAEFETLQDRDLSETVCVVFDVLRATSSMVTALANGAESIRPVSEIAEALEARRKDPEVLLAGERDGLRIQANLTGGIDFDLGNSPREFTKDKVAGKRIVMTTTNGTRALRACAHARIVVVSSFLNLKATRQFLQPKPLHLIVVCGGTFEQPALEDVLAAGALCDYLFSTAIKANVSDSVLMAVTLLPPPTHDLSFAVAQSRNARRLLSRPELRDDVAYCAQRDIYDFVAEMGKDGLVRNPDAELWL
jgi:2-phosphosulfolactate phosphatase